MILEQGADGFQIQYTSDESMRISSKKVKVTKTSARSYLLKDIDRTRPLRVRMRAYYITRSKHIYGPWSEVEVLPVG